VTSRQEDDNRAFAQQETDDEVVEVDERGSVHAPGHTPQNRKKVVLLDFQGEYGA
jgi:hypothetical protein